MLGIDPLDGGLAVLNAHRLASPLLLRGPTLVGALDTEAGLADFCARLARVAADPEVAVLVDLGGPGQRVVRSRAAQVAPTLAGPRTSLYVDAGQTGLAGAVAVMDRLRAECPWDRRQTHHSLVKNLLEETHELADVLAALPLDAGRQDAGASDPEPDWMAFEEVCEELGDVFLQVLFHAAMAAEAGIFDIEDVAEGLRQKLVRRHPHVFSDVAADTAEQVKAQLGADQTAGEAPPRGRLPAGRRPPVDARPVPGRKDPTPGGPGRVRLVGGSAGGRQGLRGVGGVARLPLRPGVRRGRVG